MNREHIVLLLTDSNFSIHLATRNQSIFLAQSPTGEAAAALLRVWMAKKPHTDFHLLLDLADEDFCREPIPHLAGSDRRAFITRKLDQTYLHTPYRHSLLQRDAKHNGQRHALLSAIPRQEEIDRIVTLLLQQRCALIGIYSVALASDELYRRLGYAPACRLLISHHAHGMIRQSYFSALGLCLSRVVSMGHATSANLASQTRQLHQYLLSRNAIAREQTLQVHLIVDKDSASEFTEAFSTELPAGASYIATHIEPVSNLANKLGITGSCNNWQVLLLSAIARGWIPNHYAPAPARRYFVLRKLKKALQAASALLVVLGLAIGSARYSTAQEQQRLLAETAQQIQAEATQQNTLQASIMRIPAFEKQADIALYQAHLAHWPDVEQSAQRISQILLNHPVLVIDSFTWHAHTGPQLPDDDAIESPSPVSAQHTTGTPRWQIMTLNGHIASLGDDYRRINHEIERCLAALASLPHSTVSLRKTPLDLRPQNRISQQALEGQGIPFILYVMLAPAGELAQ